MEQTAIYLWGTGLCTFWIWRGPGHNAPHKTAVEQDFPREAAVFTEVLQVLPPLAPFAWCTHVWKLTVVKYNVLLFCKETRPDCLCNSLSAV